MRTERQGKELSPEVLRQLYWDKKRSLSWIADSYGINITSVLKRMKKYGIERRSLSESGYLFHSDKPGFNIKTSLHPEEEKLLVAGIMLYWAEGTLKRDTIDFANSNPRIIKVFLKFLREICGVNESRLRAYIYAFSDQNSDKIKEFWKKTTGIPETQFIKPYIRKAENSTARKRRMEYGLIKIRYSDKKLLCIIKKWLEEYTKNIGRKSG